MSKTLVTRETVYDIIDHLSKEQYLVFDTETTGLSSFHGSKLFSLAVSDLMGNAYYFNFKSYRDLDTKYVLTRAEVEGLFHVEHSWIAHNAKFDLHMCDKAGWHLKGEIIDTVVMARLFENHWQYRGGYSLDVCAKRWLSIEKDDAVKKWMDEHDAFFMGEGPDGRQFKNYQFDQVPFDIISPYAMQDAIVTGELYKFLDKGMYENQVLKTEIALTPILYRMESRGIEIDTAYCREAYEYEQARMEAIAEELRIEFIWPEDNFVDSAKVLAPVLKELGCDLPPTEEGNLSISDKALSPYGHLELVKQVLNLRDATKRATTYFGNYLKLADDYDTIHTNLNQGGTGTGRLSCSNPNLQNIPSEDEGLYPVRRAFRARPNTRIVSIDYRQMEFRLMLEYAQEMGLIKKIIEGMDPHDATAQETGLARKPAKTLNFGLLYGMGIAKLAETIGVTFEEAKKFKYLYFDRLPGVKYFIRQASDKMLARGYTMNLYGRRFYLEDPKWAYKAANCIIQGGCADIVKAAMVELAHYLADKHSVMLLQIHDEIIFEVHESEFWIIPELKRIMEIIYKHKYLPMECSVEWGMNLHDMEPWNETDTAGKNLPDQSLKEAQNPPA